MSQFPLRTLLLLLPCAGCALGLDAHVASLDEGEVEDDDDDDNGGSGGSGASYDTGSQGGSDGGSGSSNGVLVSGLEPDFGSTAGGTIVEISGGPFDESAQVFVGSSLADVLSVDAATLTVSTPNVPTEGSYDVTVRATAGEGRLDDAFTYWADGSGLAGTIGTINFTQQVGSYWGTTTNTSSGSAAVYFIAPATFEWYELFAPTLDSCANEDQYSFNGEVSIYDPGVARIELQGSRSLTLTWDSEYGVYQNASLTTSTWAANDRYTLAPMTGGFFPEVSVTDFAETPPTPNLTTPYISGGSPPSISPQPLFSWTPTGADWVLITLGLWNEAGTEYSEVIHCVAADDGIFQADTNQFSQWPFSRQLDVYFGPAHKPAGQLPWNNAQSEIVGITRIYGAGFTSY